VDFGRGHSLSSLPLVYGIPEPPSRLDVAQLFMMAAESSGIGVAISRWYP
jgi:hypothetical protein